MILVNFKFMLPIIKHLYPKKVECNLTHHIWSTHKKKYTRNLLTLAFILSTHFYKYNFTKNTYE